MSTITNERAIQALLQVLMGPPASGELTVRSTGATGTVPAQACLIPIDTGELDEEAMVFVQPNPATEDGSWPVTSGGTAVQVEALQGGARGNRASGAEYRFDPPLEGIEAVATTPTGLTGGVASGAFGALAQLRLYRNLEQETFKSLLFAQLGDFPGAVLAWESTMPLDGPMAARPAPRQARAGTGKFWFRHSWMLFLVTSRLDTEAQRRREGAALRDALLALLLDRRGARGFRVSMSPGIEILSAAPYRTTPTSYVDLVRFACTVTLESRPLTAEYNPWLTTRIRQQTPSQGANPPLDLPDYTIDMD